MRRAERTSPAEWVALAALFALAAALILRAGRGMYFTGDEWEWIERRSSPGVASLLDGFNDHWMTVPIGIHQILYRVVGFESQLPYRLVVLVAHLATAFLLYWYLRVRVGRVVAFALAGTFAFYGYASRVITFPVSVGWAIGVAAVIGALLLLEHEERRDDLGACGLLLVATASSSVAIPFVVGIIVELLLRRAWRRLWVPGGPLVLYAIWWATFRSAGSSTTERGSIVDTIRYARRLADQAVGTFLGIGPRGSGASLALGAVVVGMIVVWLGRGRPRSPRLVGLAVASVLLVGAIASTRAGSSGVQSWYAYPIAASILLLVGELFNGARVRTPIARALIGGTVVLVALSSVWWNAHELERATDIERFVATVERAQLGVLESIDADVPSKFRPLIYTSERGLTAGRYREIVARDGSLGWSVRRVAEYPGARLRSAADETLVRGLGLRPVPYRGPPLSSAPAGLDVRSGEGVDDGCIVVRSGVEPAVVDVVDDSLDVVVIAESDSASLDLGWFAGPSQPIGTVESGEGARIRAQALGGAASWTLRVQSKGSVRLCAGPTTVVSAPQTGLAPVAQPMPR